MIQIIPAIDLMNGSCVRLEQGRFENKKKYSIDPVEKAMEWENSGLERLHIVDLDGAKNGNTSNLKTVKEICKHTRMKVDYGGGIRATTDLDELFSIGISYITIGSIAVKKPDLFRQWMDTYGPEKFILAADVKEESIAISGWQETTGMAIFELINAFEKYGLQQVMCTDISRDGMLKGVSTELYRKLKQEYPKLNIIASGGVTSIDDVCNLEKEKIDAVIVGKALFEDKIKSETLNNFQFKK